MRERMELSAVRLLKNMFHRSDMLLGHRCAEKAFSCLDSAVRDINLLLLLYRQNVLILYHNHRAKLPLSDS